MFVERHRIAGTTVKAAAILRRIASVHANRYGIIAKEESVLHACEMQRFSTDRRYATLTAFVIECQAR